MKTIATISIAGEFQWPKLASCEDNPPRLTVENMCIIASAQSMPAIR